MLGECTDATLARDTGDHSYFAHCLVDNVDEIYDEFKSRGADFLFTPRDQPWAYASSALLRRTVIGLYLDN